jgi:hypothetical protein
MVITRQDILREPVMAFIGVLMIILDDITLTTKQQLRKINET